MSIAKQRKAPLRAASSLALLAALAAAVEAQVPNRPPTYVMNQSTIIMPCNYSGYTDPASTAGWAVVDFDWSNAKQIWAKDKPMDCEAKLMQQVHLTTGASPGTTVWIYRNTIYGYPWFESVQRLLNTTDADGNGLYGDWFMRFKPTGPWTSPRCDSNYNPPLCSMLYHGNQQTPGYPSGDGDCAAPACDVGAVPAGFYVFKHNSTTQVNGQTFLDWFVNDYLLDPTSGASPLVSGFFFDDYWSSSGLSPSVDSAPNSTADMGLSPADIEAQVAAYNANMEVATAAILKAGKFAWRLLWTGGSADATGTTCPAPLVQQATCASDLRSLCAATSPQQANRTMMYAFGPGACRGNPANLTQFEQDLANFLLVRGPYAFLGHGWLGCSQTYVYPSALNGDYGEPTELCRETAPNSGVFVREWTKATVQMDCNTWTPSITMK